MLIAYLAVDLDGSPALESYAQPCASGAGGDAVKLWLSSRVDMDEDGGAIFCLAVTGDPGDRVTVKQDGQIVAVVVRA